MKVLNFTSLVLGLATATSSLLLCNVNGAKAANPVQINEPFAISPMDNSNYVVDKFGVNNINSQSKAHLYDKSDKSTHELVGYRSPSGSYEVHLKANQNVCFGMAGGLNPNQGNGTLAEFKPNCNDVLNLMFFDDGTIRVARNLNLCLTNQGNRKQLFNKLHFWACDGSPETKFTWYSVNSTIQTPYVAPQHQPQVQPQSQPQQQPSTPTVRPRTFVETKTYEDDIKYSAVLMSARAGYIPGQSQQVGHTTVALIKRWVNVSYPMYSDGTSGASSKTSQETINTITSPGPFMTNSNGSIIFVNHATDGSFIPKYKEAAGKARHHGYSFLESQISSTTYYGNLPSSIDSRGQVRDNYLAISNCTKYLLIPQVGSAKNKNSKLCNCTTASARIFYHITGLDASMSAPSSMAESIDVYHGYSSSPSALIKFW